MEITVLYFAALVDITHRAEETVDWLAPGSSISSLLDGLAQRGTRVNLPGVRVAKNEEFVSSDAVLMQGDVVALIPPVSGG